MFDFPDASESMVSDMLRGMAACRPDRYTLLGANVVMNGDAALDRVAVITSGGGGAEPQFAGYTGPGMADAACTGNLRSAPNAYALYEAGRLLGRERGVLFVYNNFAGDVLNNDMAEELLALDGIEAKSILLCDDVASARGEPRDRRGGLCGLLFVIKIAAEASRRGLSLDECRNLAAEAETRVGSITLVGDDASGDIMFGAGFSGEPPLSRTTDRDARAVAETVCGMITDDIKPQPSESLEILVNRLSGSSFMESYVFADVVRGAFLSRGFAVGRVHVGNYFNPVAARGYYLSVIAADEELRDYLGGVANLADFSF